MKNLFKLHGYKGSLLAAILLFYLMKPYFVWHGLLGSNLVVLPVSLLLGLLFGFNRDLSKKNILLLLLFVSLFVLNTILSGRNLIYLLSILPFTLLPFGNRVFTKSVYENFLSIYCLITVVSLFVWFLHLLNLAPIIGTIAPLNALKQYNYTVYPLLVSVSDNIRFYCVFDEPGVVGTISGILLCCQKFNFKDNRTVIIMISGLCSLSMFFYVLCWVYLIIYYVFEKESIFKSILLIVLLFTFLFIIQSIPVLNEILGSRFIWDSEAGKFAGDNRTNELVLYYMTKVMGTKEFWFGLDNVNLFIEQVQGESNVYIIILVYGALLCLLYLFLMTIYCLSHKKKWSTFILFMIVFLATVYQRPYLFIAEFIFLWTYLARIDDFEYNI